MRAGRRCAEERSTKSEVRISTCDKKSASRRRKPRTSRTIVFTAESGWPASAAALVDGGYLKQVPLDSFDGRPMRYRLLPDGILVYSIGPTGSDDGGARQLRHPPGLMDADTGFRLWDPALPKQ